MGEHRCKIVSRSTFFDNNYEETKFVKWNKAFT